METHSEIPEKLFQCRDRDLIYVTERGYYDTADEKTALLTVGSVVDLLDSQPGKPPCESKRGKGLWGNATCLNTGNRKTVFIEDGNYSRTQPETQTTQN